MSRDFASVPTAVSGGALHRALRAATRGAHTRLDHTMLRVNLTRRQDYAMFLNLHYATLQNLKAEWRPEDVADFSLMLRCLQNDLHVMGLIAPSLGAVTREPLDADAALGMAYVIRGSRLGAAVLRRQVPASSVASYLDCVPTLSWSGFLRRLDDESTAPGWHGDAAAIRGAHITFDLFTRSLAGMLAGTS